MSLSARDILERLIGFPTVSCDSNLALIDWVADYLKAEGIAAHIMPKAGDPRKAALFAQVGPNLPGGIVLSGHTDVVPVDGQDWTFDPWTLREQGGRLYGRGACDMKGFVALAIEALVCASKCDLKRPLQIALSFDEEIGCAGAPPLIAAMTQAGLAQAGIAIIGEPSMMKLVNSHKGILAFNIHVKGHEVHSSRLPHGVNAIMEGAALIGWANAMNMANRAAVPSAIAAAFDPPWTTVHVGLIQGGTAQNITAGDCWFPIDARFVPDDDEAAWEAALRAEVLRIEEKMKAVVETACITMTQQCHVPGLRPEKESAAEALVRRLTGENGCHVVSYGTEAGHFQAAGVSSVVCGPGNIAQAHQADEYISVAQFAAGQRFLADLVRDLGV